MEIRPIVLREELMASYRHIQAQIEEVKRAAKLTGCSIHELQDSKGDFVIVPLLCSQANLLHALALLHQRQRS